MPAHLTPKEKSQCRVILALLVSSLLIQRVGQKVLDPETKDDLPAVVECTQMIDEIFRSAEEGRRKIMVDRIQLIRLRLTKKTSRMDVAGAMVGALDYITSGSIKSKPGTRLDFILQTFASNLDVLRKTVPEQNKTAKAFRSEFAKAIKSI